MVLPFAAEVTPADEYAPAYPDQDDPANIYVEGSLGIGDSQVAISLMRVG